MTTAASHVNVIDVLAMGLIASQIGLTIFYFIMSQKSLSKVETLQNEVKVIQDRYLHLSARFEETYLLGRMLVRWIELGREDNETLKSVVDELCIASRNKVVKAIYSDMTGDEVRRESLYLSYKRIALCSEDPAYVLSSLRYLSQSGGPSEFLLALRLYTTVRPDGSVQFHARDGWSADDEVAFLSCVTDWGKRLEITGKNLRFFSHFFGTSPRRLVGSTEAIVGYK